MLAWLKRLGRKPQSQPVIREMNKWDQYEIERFAKDPESKTAKARAISAYRKTPKLQHGDEGLAHYLFMREVDTTAPDYSWRAIQRQRLLDSLED
jgi:hypothetical protein